ncbi:hypothetical protein BGW39_005821 [Mortierella sp. 14UC]|nr:hypothetical protein BGW39_005821 [Mortierella sp. 14UC]
MPDKIATAVLPVVTTFSVIPSVPIKETAPPATTAKVPVDPPKSTAIAPTITPTTAPTIREAVKTATATAPTTAAVSPLPTKKSGWTLFPGITILTPFELTPHDHGRDFTKDKTEPLARQSPAKVNAIDNNDDEREDEHVKNENKDDADDNQEDRMEDRDEIERAEQRAKQDDRGRFEEADSNGESEDEEEKPKQQTKKGGQQNVLKQLSLENIAVSKLEIPDTFDDSTLDFHTGDEVEALYSFRASPSSQDPVFHIPRAVSRASTLTSIFNTLLPSFVLRFRADLRNFLFWICSPNASAHLDGKDSSGDDSFAKKIAQEDVDKLIHPDESIDLKALWDPRIGALALKCIKNHAQIFVNEVVSLGELDSHKSRSF